ncbi:ATP-grasp domain-containing protein [Streptomyces sp. NPDC006879]|uniref:ATP-grasp domain-containing protein n=1 Tax=Streptomyces sp. NPDC006879 TaxID=3364767 RepID=UPI0036CC1558
MQRHVILVDPYSGAAEYANAFRERGIEPVAVLSTPGPLDSYRRTWSPDTFYRTHCFNGNLSDLVGTVKDYDPVAIVPGNESAVMLVDLLVAELMPGSGNVLELSEARRDKWPMAEVVAAAGIPHLRQIATADPREVSTWIDENELQGWPLVLKPRRSGGTDDVHKVGAGEDWRPYFDRLLGSVNRFDISNDTVLVQEFAPGSEYIVDTYSVDGKFGVVSVSRYSKSAKYDRIGIYDALDYLSPEDPIAQELTSYARQVAEAVGVRNGATHTEIMLTDEGPRLIEIAARLAGSCLQYAARCATGDSQIDRTVRHYLDGAFTPGYEIVRPVRVVWLSSPRAGILCNAEVLDQVRELETFQRLGTPYATGDVVPCTEDLFTSLGWVILGGTDQESVDADTLRVKEVESQLVVEP